MKRTLSKRVTAIMAAAVLAISFCISACAAAVDTGFSDVPANAWYVDAVEYVRDNGLMSGTTATTFAIGAEGPAGTLAYFAPWGDVVMYYSSCGPYGGLYELGHAVSGGEQIKNLSGTLQITQILD